VPGNYYGHPGVQYNGQIHPLVPYAIRGAIWYHGGANAPFYVDYRTLLPGLIASWRKDWRQGDFPFGIVALAALGTVYGQRDKPYVGPTHKSMAIKGAAIRVRFDSAGGLHARGEPPVGFAVAGADRVFHFAKARIEGDSVVVWSERVPKPVAVRYAWATNPVCNLYNSEDLPMFQFRTDDWDQAQIVMPKDDPIVLPSGWIPN
jgi:sialate O-acetylesterase